jgi:hypothetical protein
VLKAAGHRAFCGSTENDWAGYGDGLYDFMYFDEYEGEVPMKTLNLLLEGTYMNLRAKFSVKVVKNENLPILINSNHLPHELYKNRTRGQLNALLQRMYILYVDPQRNGHIIWNPRRHTLADYEFDFNCTDNCQMETWVDRVESEEKLNPTFPRSLSVPFLSVPVLSVLSFLSMLSFLSPFVPSPPPSSPPPSPLLVLEDEVENVVGEDKSNSSSPSSSLLPPETEEEYPVDDDDLDSFLSSLTDELEQSRQPLPKVEYLENLMPGYDAQLRDEIRRGKQPVRSMPTLTNEQFQNMFNQQQLAQYFPKSSPQASTSRRTLNPRRH